MIYLILGVFGIYYLFVLLLIAGWVKAVTPAPGKTGKSGYHGRVSVLVPFRNESTNLKTVIASLSAQVYPDYEVILVNDHSDDVDMDAVNDLLAGHPNFRVIMNRGSGKKAAVTTGVDAALGDIIVVTDADCAHLTGWLATMAEIFGDDQAKMGFGAVKISGSESAFQSLEFISVVATGVALSGLGKPIYCNGANMAFRKKVFREVGGYQDNLDIPSGDDEFLLKKVAKAHPQGIRFANLADSIVLTAAQPTIRHFIQQRIRWAGKWRATSGAGSKWIATFVFLFQLFYIAAFLMLVTGTHVRLTGFLLLGKFLLDFVLLFNAGNFLKERIRLMPFFVIQLLYPFYVLAIGVSANFADYSWKGRKLASKPGTREQV